MHCVISMRLLEPERVTDVLPRTPDPVCMCGRIWRQDLACYMWYRKKGWVRRNVYPCFFICLFSLHSLPPPPPPPPLPCDPCRSRVVATRRGCVPISIRWADVPRETSAPMHTRRRREKGVCVCVCVCVCDVYVTIGINLTARHSSLLSHIPQYLQDSEALRRATSQSLALISQTPNH